MPKMMLAALAAATAIALPGGAMALSTNSSDVVVNGATGAITTSIAVSLADLNLDNDHAVRTADARINRAAKKVCGYMRGSALPETRDYRTCYDAALGDARQDLDTMVQAERQG